MSIRTSEERRKRTRRVLVLGSFAGFLLVLAVVPAVRDWVLHFIGLAEQLRDLHGGTLATGAVILVIILAIIENAEKLHFVWEMGHKLLGYDLESMARHEREFTDLPDDYTSRPGLERELATELAPGGVPKLVVFTGEHDSGKTTTLHYVIPRKLKRPYKGNIILCSGDLQSIESEIGDTEEQARKRLAKRVLRRVLQHAEVPGDVGETIESMSDAIAEHFERERKPWLIVIDQIDSPRFPYAEILPAVFGLSNTVLVAAPHVQIDERVLADKTADDDGTIMRREVHMRGFTAREALEMLRKEVHKRGGRLRSGDAARLRPQLEQTSPGTIQRLSDIYINSGSSGVEQALGSGARGVRRIRAIGQTIVESFTPDLRSFVAGLGLFSGELVSRPALEALAASDPCSAASFATLRDECVQRRFLEVIPTGRRKNSLAIEQRYRITKLGRGIAQAALRGIDHKIELEMGAALLQYYRGVEAQAEALDTEAGVPNILGVMGWAETTSRLPERDIVQLTRRIREPLIRSGRWDLGVALLRSGEEAAARLELFRSYGELSAARAELLLAMGYAHSALRLLDVARDSFRESSAQVESNLSLGIGDESTLDASLDYDALQLRWLTHLEIAAHLALLPAEVEAGALESLRRTSEEAGAWLRNARRGAAANAAIAASVAGALEIDHLQVMLLIGDAYLRAGDRAGADRCWRTVGARLGELRAASSVSVTALVGGRRRLRAQIERLEGGLGRRLALRGPRVLRPVRRVQARRHLARGLGFATPHGYQGALILLESAEVDLAGFSVRHLSASTAIPHERPAFVRLTRRWRHLQSARRKLLLAHADATALGALPAQFASLMALVSVTEQLEALDGRPGSLRAAAFYAQSATTIAERLREEMPNLLDQVRELPRSIAAAPSQQPMPAVAGRSP